MQIDLEFILMRVAPSKRFLYLFILTQIVMACHAAHAQQSKFVGMHHLSSVPDAAPASPPPEHLPEQPAENIGTGRAAPAVSHESPSTALIPAYKLLAVKDSLIKLEALEKWPHLDEAALATTDQDIRKLVYGIEMNRGNIPPQGLFLAAKTLADHHIMERAAVYFFVGQLRLSFDAARWPARDHPDDVKRRAQDKNKTPDQASPNQDTPLRVIDPHSGVRALADSIGQPIMSWAVHDPATFHKILDEVRQWDASAPYAYMPDYDPGDSVPFESWEKLLKQSRENYFSYMANLGRAMEKAR